MDRTELLERIYATSDDDTLRLVFADWLSSSGDELGEFIALTLRQEAGALSKREAGRIKSLLTKHRVDWLGPLSAITNTKDSLFRRGFLSHWVLRTEAAPSAWRAALEQPMLQTVESVRCWATNLPDVVAVLGQRALQNLKKLNLFEEMLLPFEQTPPPWRLDELSLHFAIHSGHLASLTATAAFCAVTRLDCHLGPRQLIWDSPFGQRLKQLSMTTPALNDEAAQWLTSLADVPITVGSLELRAQCWYRLERDEAGAFTRLGVETGHRGLGIGEASELLPRMKGLGLEAVHVRHAGEKFLADFLPTLHKGLDALGPLKSLRVPEVGEGTGRR